jgi:hypothetical protein
VSPAIAILLALLPVAGNPRQDSTDTQMADVEVFLQVRGCFEVSNAEKALVANRLGMYDAADIYQLRARKVEASATA